jgi:hypothetical protein
VLCLSDFNVPATRSLNLSARATFANHNKQRREHKMKATAGTRYGKKRNRSRTARAKGQHAPTRKARAVPLNASPEATRKQDLQRKPRKAHLHQRPANGGMVLSTDAMGLMNRRTKAFLDLPLRIARCHSPFEVWSEQARFVHESFADYAHHISTCLGGRTRGGGLHS